MVDTSAIVGVVVGLIFVFSLVAILVTQINNLISSLLNWRAKQLREGLEYLVSDPKIQYQVLSHPIINVIPEKTGLTEEQLKKAALYSRNAVNYIPPNTFVEALISILIDDVDKNVFNRLELAIKDLPRELQQTKTDLLVLTQKLSEEISDGTINQIYNQIYAIDDDYAVYRDKLLNGMSAVEEALRNLSFRSYQRGDLVPILNGINRIETPAFRNALQSVLATARTLDEGRERLALWFDDNMDRASEIFQKRLQIISLIVAFSLTMIFNIDAIYIGQTLLSNDELRDDVVRAAQRFEREAEIQGMMEEQAADETQPDSGGEGIEEVITSAEEIRATAQTLLNLQLPIGWQYVSIEDRTVQAISENANFIDLTSNPRNLWNYVPGNNPDWLSLLFWKLLGLSLTTIAAAQGAPFWFDLLRRISGR